MEIKCIHRVFQVFFRRNLFQPISCSKRYCCINNISITPCLLLLSQSKPPLTNIKQYPTILINKRYLGKKRRTNVKLNNEINSEEPKKLKLGMNLILTKLHETLQSIRGNEITADFFESISAHAYDKKMPLKSLAHVVMTRPRRVEISCYDKKNCKMVIDAVKNVSDMGLNPVIEDDVIIVTIPRISIETRKALVKKLGKLHEEARTKLRLLRRSSLDFIKKRKENSSKSGIADDEMYRLEKEIDAVSGIYIKDLERIIRKKQEDVMNVN